MPSSSIPVPDRDAGTYASPRKNSSAEDYRRHNAKLRSDLEAERAKIRQVLRDKSAEIKRIQENFDREKQKTIELTSKRLTNEHAAEIKKVRENIAKEKDNELRQVLKFKEEEVKTLKQQVLEEKEKNRSAEEELRRVLADKGKEGEDRSEIERKLRSEIASLKEQKHKVDEMYRIKAADDNEKAEMIRRLRAEHEIELQKFMKDSKRESIQSLHQRRLTEKALEEKAHELAFKDHLAKKLEAEKGDLERRLSHGGDLETLRRSNLHRMGSSLDFDSSERLDESPLAKKDKERELKKKNAELQSKVENLEKKCAVLEKETLKSGNVKATFVAEEKIKKLKKRNSELVSIARQLEEKAKKLQEEKVQAKKLAENHNNSTKDNSSVDHVKKVYARQRAKDLAEHAKSLMSKEKELEDLKKQLSSQHSDQQLPKEKVEELQTIIRQSAKERLWLERQISNIDASRTPSPLFLSGDFATEVQKKTEKLDAVEAENKKLKASVDQLQKAEAESAKLASELREKEKENHKLVNELGDKQTRCAKLEHEREKFAAKCTMLQKKNAEMGKRIEELMEVEDQVSDLKEKLEVSDMKCSLLTEEGNKMKTQLEELLKVKEDLKKMEEQKKIIEKEHLSSLEKLKEREEEIRQLHKIQEEANKAHEMAVTSLEDTVRSLEQKCTDSEENNVNLKKQVEELRQLEKEYVKNLNKEGYHKSTQTTYDSSLKGNDGRAIDDHPRVEEFNSQSSKVSPSRTPNETPARPSAHVIPRKSSHEESKSDSPHATPTKQSAAVAGIKRSEDKPSGSDDILDVLHTRIDELAASDSEDDIFGEKEYSEEKDDAEESEREKPQRPDLDLDDLSKRINQAAISDDSSSLSTRERENSDASLELLSMAEGDLGDMEDNQPDSSAPEDEQMENSPQTPIGILNVRKNQPASNEQQTSGVTNHEPREKDETQDSRYIDADVNDVDPAIMEKLAVYIARYSYDPVQHSPNENPEMELAFQAGDYLYVFGEMDEDGYFLGELMNGQRGLVPSNFVEKVADESEMSTMMNGTGDLIDDLVDSSDEEDAEDDDSVSEDGETSAELVLPEENGERQLKPVRMLRFSGKLHRALRLSVEHIPDVGLGDIKEEDENEIHNESEHVLDKEDGPKGLTVNQDGAISDETDSEFPRVPSPRRLFLERQFTRSVLLSWKPADFPPEEVKGYGVYVNGDLRLMIKGGDKTKALLEDIDPEETHRISVRTVTTNGEESSDRSAVVTIGKDANLAPSHVHVTCVSPTSAKIEWSPGNSSFSHEILVNGTLHRTIRAGIFQHTITNLEPDHMYKVHVRAKSGKKVVDEGNELDIVVDFLTAETEFRTEPGGKKESLPDPPLDVKASLGHANSLDVNWIPVTITDKGTSNGARVTGYKVYINGFPCTEITSPTADGVTAVSWMVERAIKRSHSEVLHVIVRTQSCEGESADSNEVELPIEMFNFKVNQFVKSNVTEPIAKTANLVSQNSVEDKDSGLHNDAAATIEQKERSDSVKRYSRDESGKPILALVNGSHEQGDGVTTPVAQPRTMGEPIVWKNEEVDDSEIADSISNYDERESENEDEEQVEVWTPDFMHDRVTTTGKETEEKKPKANSEEHVEDLDKRVEDVDSEEAEVPEGELYFDDDDVLPIEEEKLRQLRPQITKKDSDLSVISDIDVEELERSLDAAQSISRRNTEVKVDQEAKKPYIRPLEYEESDFESESSEQEPLSIIQEEDEEDLSESVAFPSNFSQSHSASEGFQSDDDVMDLLDEDDGEGELAAHGVNIRKISGNGRPAEAELSSVDKTAGSLGLGQYLTKSDDILKVDSSQNSHYRLLDNIELEDSEAGIVEGDDLEATYSDTEADRDGLERPSAPLDEHEQGNIAHQGMEQDEANPEDVALEEEEEEEHVPSGQGADDGAALEEQVRVFLALYDYDPSSMSPNPDAEEEELAFNEGDLIKVYGDKDEDGFYWGELNGRAGYIPFNMVSEVPLEEYDAGSSMTTPSLDITQESIQSYEHGPSHEPEVDASAVDNTLDDVNLEEGEFEDPRNSGNYHLKPRRMVALFDYDPQTLSPNPDSDVELKFKVGDVIYVYGDMDEDGFFTGELRGIRGLVPSNFLEDLSDPSETRQGSAHEDSYESPLASAEKYRNINGGTNHVTPSEDTPKKKKGIFSKGKQMFKKIAKSHNSQNSKR
ncbi:peripheral-type benzodiazepine receptor-associated protein 1-like isoform X3 [Montipora foliosa]|uniref:peripheral-type benzodiazepine receptor-associated protein 1-like isoform X3 n=1 Tax=Montipora foliosa TaxID=591990 RepID=UPI0035F13F68